MLYHAVVVLFLFAAGGASSKSWILPLKSSFHSKAKSAVKKQRNRVLAFGDYSEIPETCPASTTCPVVCVENVADCPTTCPDGTLLCSSGFCEKQCDEEQETPCLCEALPIACPKTINFYEACLEEFSSFYEKDTECQEEEASDVPLVSLQGPVFILVYSWISVVTFAVIAWCFFNQKLFPVHSSMKPLKSCSNEDDSYWTHTAYKSNLIGTFIHYMVLLTLIGIQFLLLILSIFYYIQQEAITRWQPVFQDEVQVLLVFQIVWFVGLIWSFAFQYPTSVQSLFLRRCTFQDATHIAVTAPTKAFELKSIPGTGDKIVRMVWFPVNALLRLIFSYPHSDPDFVTTICRVHIHMQTGRKYFYHRMRRYTYDEETDSFSHVFFDTGSTVGDLLSQIGGLQMDEVIQRQSLVGPNVISLPKPTLLGSIKKEFGKPYYLYQNFMLWSWAPYWYYYMATINTAVRLTGGIVVSMFQFMSDSVLYQISLVEGDVEVLRDGEFVSVSVRDVVPGDIVVITPGSTYFDMVVLKGDLIVVDESALTGEATPVTKSELDSSMKDVKYDNNTHQSSAIYAGTEVLEVRKGSKELGLVTKTGSFTSKGELLSEVLSYQRHKLKFDDEVMVVVIILIFEAIFLVSLVYYFLDDQWVYAWFYGMYVVAAILPPLLPTVFVVSVGISAKRLQIKRVTCKNPEGILIAGKVNAAFFDKTGTLTSQGMDFHSIDTCLPKDENSQYERKVTLIQLGMAVCHTLSLSESDELLGNHVDKAAFNSLTSSLRKGDLEKLQVVHNEKIYTILRKFDFDTHRATQSVIVQDDAGDKLIFVKGSPEAIEKLSEPSTVPKLFQEKVRSAAKSGMYQIAMAYKVFDSNCSVGEVLREEIEKSLVFCGLIGFQNTMKVETPEVLSEIENGSVSLTMVTGDSVLTGVFMARQAGIIKPNRQLILGSLNLDGGLNWIDADTDKLIEKPVIVDEHKNEVDIALSGDTWEALLESDKKYALMIAEHIRVFGRCNPVHKVSVISTFIEKGYITLMCGDGQNDCGALKSAHVGIALSTAEASLVAPFTSIDKDIKAVVELLREGRCALASAFAAYKYYILYGQIEAFLQTMTAYLSVTFSEWCWIFLDGIWSTTMAFSLPLANAAKRLSPVRPTASLFSLHTLSSACGLLAINFLFQIIALLALFGQDWFQCRKWNSEDVSNVLTIGDNYETTALFVVGGFQYYATAMSLNFGYTFRENWWKNYIFVALAALWTSMQFVMTIHPSNFSCIWRVNCNNEMAMPALFDGRDSYISNPWNTTIMPVKFRWILVGIMASNLLSLIVWEYYFVNGFLNRFRLKNSATKICNEK